MGGLSRSKHEDECGVACTVGKAVKKIFTEKPKSYDEHTEKEPTTGQVHRLRNKSIQAIEEQGL